MKKIFKILAIAFVGMGLVSCEKDEDQAILNETSQSSISADKTIIILDKNNVDATAVNFTWAKSGFDLSVVSTQQIEFGMKGKNFQDSKLVDVVSSPFSMTNKQLNALVLSMGGIENVFNELEIRFKTSVGGAKFYSNVIKLNVSPYILGPVYNYTDLFMIGDATAGDWDNSATNAKLYPLQKTVTAGKYSYTGYFAKGGLKLIKTPGSWDFQYGMGGAEGVLSTSGSSGNISVVTAGYYKLTVDINALTYTLVSIPAPTKTYTTISMIGSASGDWNTDVDLQKSTFDPHVWVKKKAALNAGDLKFRADHDWSANWGVAQEFFGVAEFNGGNIPVKEAFNYDVYFNDITGEFSLIPVF